MRMRDILAFLKQYIILGIVALIIIGLLFLIGYKLVYKKLMKGKKNIEIKKLILYGISIGYIIVVLGATFMNRGQVYKTINLNLFSSYKEAYNLMKLSLFRNLILNMLLFFPFGFLLPFYSDKLKKMYKVVLIGFGFTLLIEIFQYISNFGIFEIDDIFDNTIGVIIGYSIFMIYTKIKEKRKFKEIIVYFIPIILVISVFLGIYIKYQSQQYGNLDFEYITKVNMKKVNFKNNIANLSNSHLKKNIYYRKKLNKTTARKFADGFFSNIGVKIDDRQTQEYEDTIIYNAGGYNMWIELQDGSYRLSNHNMFDGTHNYQPITGLTKEEVFTALNKVGINPPIESEFSEKDSRYYFTIDQELDNKYIKGTLQCLYYDYDNGSVNSIANNIISYSSAVMDGDSSVEIISEQEAFKQIEDGKFGYARYYGKLDSLEVNSINLTYYQDTKGYLVPVYKFNVIINNMPDNIFIKAMK